MTATDVHRYRYKECKFFGPEQHEAAKLAALALLQSGYSVQMCDGSGWYPHVYPDDQYVTPNGSSPAGGRDYIKRGCGLVERALWRLSVWEPIDRSEREKEVR